MIAIVRPTARLTMRTLLTSTLVTQAQVIQAAAVLMTAAPSLLRLATSVRGELSTEGNYVKKLRNHYDNLKVSQRATSAEIRQSYRRLASLHHPDKNNNSEASIQAMQHINKAYEVLSCPAARADHDRWIEACNYGCDQPNPSPTAPFGHGKHGTAWTKFNEPRGPGDSAPMFDANQFPPKNWNPAHIVEFTNYFQAMRRLLDYEIKEYGEHMTLDVLYRAFLMDKRLGNLGHTSRSSARESLIRSFSHREKAPMMVAYWVKTFRSLDPPLRQAVILAGLVTGALILALFL